MIGGLQNGKLIAQYLNNNISTELVRVYVLKDELGKNISDFIVFDDAILSDKLKKVDKIYTYADEIVELQPDIIFVVERSQLVSEKIIRVSSNNRRQ